MDDTNAQDKDVTAAIARGEEALAGLRSNYPSWIAEEIRSLQDAYSRVQNDPNDRGKLAVLSLCAHDLKGNAALFGYPTIGEISAHLIVFIAELDVIDSTANQLLFYHVQAVKAILNECPIEETGEKVDMLLNYLKIAADTLRKDKKIDQPRKEA